MKELSLGNFWPRFWPTGMHNVDLGGSRKVNT